MSWLCEVTLQALTLTQCLKVLDIVKAETNIWVSIPKAPRCGQVFHHTGAEPVVMGNGWELVEMLVTRHEDADEDAEAAPLDEDATFHDYSDDSCTSCTRVHHSCSSALS